MTTITTRTIADVPTYYGQPAVKPSLYGWTVALYIFVGGTAGAAQVLVTAADLLATPGSAGVILAGRVLALVGAIVGAILLIVELHTPRRYFNMLRIFRPTSPMSIGTYVLISFGFWSLAALIVELVGIHWLTLIFACLAAIAGWFMTTYTASLLAATSTPLWAAAPRLLALRFAASSFASGAAVLVLVAIALDAPIARALANFIILALAIELIASIAAQFVYGSNGVAGPLRAAPWGPLHAVAVQLCGDLLPIALIIADDLAGARADVLVVIASVCTLGGSFLLRGLMFLAGNESARRPQDYFHFTRADRSGS